jgi:hypothetical protein
MLSYYKRQGSHLGGRNGAGENIDCYFNNGAYSLNFSPFFMKQDEVVFSSSSFLLHLPSGLSCGKEKRENPILARLSSSHPPAWSIIGHKSSKNGEGDHTRFFSYTAIVMVNKHVRHV